MENENEGRDVQRPTGVSMTRDEQLDRWVSGELDGKGEAAHLDGGDCCPDFACCNEGVATTEYDRQRFVDADGREREGMLVGFLAKALQAHYGPGSVATSEDAFKEAQDTEGEEWKL